MKKKHGFKNNTLRILDNNKIIYEIKEYSYDEDDLSGQKVAAAVDLAWQMVYKTLVLVANDKEYLVACIPVTTEIDLKKLAKLSGHKSVELIPVKDLLSLTGYLRGGCSPVGMKKQFPTYFAEDIIHLEKVAFSAGKRGYQMIVDPKAIISLIGGQIGDITRKV